MTFPSEKTSKSTHYTTTFLPFSSWKELHQEEQTVVWLEEGVPIDPLEEEEAGQVAQAVQLRKWHHNLLHNWHSKNNILWCLLRIISCFKVFV
jgi:hypothetical protein